MRSVAQPPFREATLHYADRCVWCGATDLVLVAHHITRFETCLRLALPGALEQVYAEGLDPGEQVGRARLIAVLAAAPGVADAANGAALCEGCASDADDGHIDAEELRRRVAGRRVSRPQRAKFKARDRGASIRRARLPRRRSTRKRRRLTLDDLATGMLVSPIGAIDRHTGRQLIALVERTSEIAGEVMVVALRPQVDRTKCLSCPPGELVVRDRSQAHKRLLASRPLNWPALVTHLARFEAEQAR